MEKKKLAALLLTVGMLVSSGCNEWIDFSEKPGGKDSTQAAGAGDTKAGGTGADSSGSTADDTKTEDTKKEDTKTDSTKTDDTKTEGTEAGNTAAVDFSDIFSNRDFEVGYDADSSARIKLDKTTASCSSDAVEISGSTVTIKDEGTYILTGALDDGMVIVDADKKDKIQLVLDNATIHSETCAPVYVLKSDKVFLTMAAGSDNTLSNGGTFTAIDENNIDAVIYSREDLTLNGSGTLTVTSPGGHGIVSKDSLKVTSGSYDINCASHGLSGKDDVCIANADFKIESGKDGIHAQNTDDASLGFAYIQSGTFEIKAEGDGISASSCMQVEDGSFDITAGGGSENASKKASDSWGAFPGGGRHPGGRNGSVQAPSDKTQPDGEQPDGMPSGELPSGKMLPDEKLPGKNRLNEGTTGNNPPDGEQSGNNLPGGEQSAPPFDSGITNIAYSAAVSSETQETSSDTSDSSSMKGVKADGELTINGGTFKINSADDSVHSNTSVSIGGGTFETASGDDAFHADESLEITDGNIRITESYEGIEALHIRISGGDITLKASDDGLNAAGGKDSSGTLGGRDGRFGHGMSTASDGSIVITGGKLHITAYGDGIDANGSIEITGGDIVVCGPAQGDTSVLDYDTSAVITGGTFIGTGASGMTQSFGSSKQGVIALRVGNQAEGTQVTVKDSSGKTVASQKPGLSYDYVIISSPEIVSGGEYQVITGEEVLTVTAD